MFAHPSKIPKIDRVLDLPEGISTNNMNFCQGINGNYYPLLVIFFFHIQNKLISVAVFLLQLVYYFQ